MLNKQDTPEDFILATQASVSVKEWAEICFQKAGFQNIEWVGEGSDEKLINKDSNKTLLEIDPQFYRPGEVPYLKGSYEKIKTTTGWTPQITWTEMLEEMLDFDLKNAKREARENKAMQERL